MTIQLAFLQGDLSQTRKLSKSIPKVEARPLPPKKTEVVDPPPAAMTTHVMSSGYTNVKTWGVRNAAGEWVEMNDKRLFPWRSAFQAEHLTLREATIVFENHSDACQLIDGCDIWAGCYDNVQTYVVRKEKKNVPAPEGLPGTGTS